MLTSSASFTTSLARDNTPVELRVASPDRVWLSQESVPSYTRICPPVGVLMVVSVRSPKAVTSSEALVSQPDNKVVALASVTTLPEVPVKV